jgi:DnaJ like chaperone protein
VRFSGVEGDMSVFTRIVDRITELSGSLLSGLVETIRTALEGDAETRRRVAFSVAMIALSAKMAKADGVVTRDEVAAFHHIFAFPAEEADHVKRLYQLAQQDVAGFEAYAARMAQLCGSGQPNCSILEDILDGLFHIAKADGVVHERELAFLSDVATIFDFDEDHFELVLARHVGLGDRDPYHILGIERGADFKAVRAQWLRLVSENHPDKLIARGLPPQFIAIANDRVAAINAAYEQIEKRLRKRPVDAEAGAR